MGFFINSSRYVLGEGPLAEIELWRAKSITLGNLSDQLGSEWRHQILSIVELATEDQTLVNNFKASTQYTYYISVLASQNLKY